MAKSTIAAYAILLALAGSFPVAPATAQSSNVSAALTIPAALPGRYNVQETALGELLDDPAAKAVLDKHLIGFSSEPQIDMGRGLTLVALQGFAPDRISTEALVAIQNGLNQLPPKS